MYTSFLQAVGAAHGQPPIDIEDIPPAYPLMSSLLEGIIERVVPPFTLSKLEGDAVFACATDADEMPRSDAMHAFLDGYYHAFRTHLSALEQALTCDCDACSRGARLDLSDAAVARLDISVAAATSVTETYDHYAPIEVSVFPLG